MSPRTPKVSVVVTCYNYGSFLPEAIASVRGQTLQDFEVLVVDDGSTDPATLAVLDGISDPGVQVFRKENGGPSSARNFGIARARGELILPLDADDRLAPTFLERCVSRMDADAGLEVVFTGVQFFGAQIGRMALPEFSEKRMLTENCLVVTALYRKTLWARVGGYNENMKLGVEDWDFWIGCLEQGARFAQVPEELFFYRIKPGSRNADYHADANRREAAYRQILANHPLIFGRHILEFHEDRRRLQALEKLRGLGVLIRLNRLLTWLSSQ